MLDNLPAILQEAYGDIVQADNTFDPVTDLASSRAQRYSNVWDRSDGRHLPIYETEADLRAIRQASRLLAARVPMAVSILNGLANYTISAGFDWKVEHPSPRLQALCESVLKAFDSNAKWAEHQERDSFLSEVSDGEFLGELTEYGGDVSLEPLTGDNLTEPLAPRPLEDYYEIDFPASWSFGVATEVGRIRPWFYHIVRNASATDWDCLEPNRIVHWRRNVPLTAKRGYADFYLTHDLLGKAYKVAGNTATGAALQAAIAYIVQHAEGVTKASVEAQVASMRGASSKVDPATGRSYTTAQANPGTVVNIPNGKTYTASNLGSNASNIYIEVMEACLRLAATVYHFPENMITGYAGNNNMASSLVAESPFVQGRLADQKIRTARTKELFRKVLWCFCQGAWARHRGYTWEQISLGLDIQVVKPSIISRDPLALTTALVQQKAAGWVSDRTAVQELGRDYETELANKQDEAEAAGMGAGAVGSGVFGQISRLQYKRNMASIAQVIGDYESGEKSRAQAEVLLSGIGLGPADVAKLLDDAQGVVTGQPQRSVESLEKVAIEVLGVFPELPSGLLEQTAQAAKLYGMIASKWAGY